MVHSTFTTAIYLFQHQYSAGCSSMASNVHRGLPSAVTPITTELPVVPNEKLLGLSGAHFSGKRLKCKFTPEIAGTTHCYMYLSCGECQEFEEVTEVSRTAILLSDLAKVCENKEIKPDWFSCVNDHYSQFKGGGDLQLTSSMGLSACIVIEKVIMKVVWES